MIKVLPFSKIDFHKWDECIISSGHCSIFGLYDSICAASKDWMGLVKNDYEAVAAIPIKKKLGLPYSWHPQFLGPIGIYGGNLESNTQAEFFNELLKISWWVKLFFWQKENSHSRIKWTDWRYQVLELKSRSIDDIRLGYNDNTVRNLKKAKKNNLQIHVGLTTENVLDYFKANVGHQIETINEESYVQLKQMMDHWMSKGYAEIKGTFDGDKLQAIGYFLKWNKQLIYYKGAVTEEGKKTGAMHCLIDYMIENSIGECEMMDFGGSNVESVARFYKGFGAEDNVYHFAEFRKL